MQRAFRRPGGAGRIDHQRRVDGRCGNRREVGGGARQHPVEILGAIRRSVDRANEFEIGRDLADDRELGQPLRTSDERPGTGIPQPIGDRLHPEQHGQRQRDGAELVDGDVAHCDGRPLRQQDRDPIAAPNAAGRERVGEPVRGFTQLAVIHFFNFAIGPHVENRSTRRIDLCPAVADVDANIVARRNLPAERAVERGVLARVRKDRGCVHRSAS